MQVYAAFEGIDQGTVERDVGGGIERIALRGRIDFRLPYRAGLGRTVAPRKRKLGGQAEYGESGQEPR